MSIAVRMSIASLEFPDLFAVQKSSRSVETLTDPLPQVDTLQSRVHGHEDIPLVQKKKEGTTTLRLSSGPGDDETRDKINTPNGSAKGTKRVRHYSASSRGVNARDDHLPPCARQIEDDITSSLPRRGLKMRGPLGEFHFFYCINFKEKTRRYATYSHLTRLV